MHYLRAPRLTPSPVWRGLSNVCFLKAVASGQVVTACCSIGDESVTFVYADGRTETERFADIVEQARLYILTDCGGSFEKFAEWGLIRAKDL